ncbi:MAG: molybdopterin biosynthesis protein [Bacillota bacterium]
MPDAAGHGRTLYLENRDPREALSLLVENLARAGWFPGPPETIPTDDALGRITAEPVFAAISSPHFHAAAMDGVAVAAAATFGASETSPLHLRLDDQAILVDTGDPLPPGTDAVIMAEDYQERPDGTLEITAAAAPWQHVRPIGEDLVVTEMIVPGGHCLRPVDLGGLLAGGVTRVAVRRRPRVAILPTGTELVQPSPDAGPGQVLEFNSRVIAGLVSEWGGAPHPLPPEPDDYERLRAAVLKALPEHDIIVLNAGSSAGREDFTARLVSELGQVLVHGVAIKPGKPLVLGVANGKPVLGLPGFSVSCWVACRLFLQPLLLRFLGLPDPEVPMLHARLARQVASPLGLEEFLRVKVGRVGDRFVATPIARGAGVISSLVRADGIVRIPPEREGLSEGADVEVELLRSRREIEGTLMVVGSHDVTLDLLSDRLRRARPGLSLASAHVGSLAGILAIRRGEAHLAGVHLMDEETGEYNVSYVRRYLPDQSAVLIHLARRRQGFMVPRGNPKGIGGFADLARPDVRLVNRQRGAGTRLLLDYHLRRAGIPPQAVVGYDREVFTHTAVAAAVAGGAADVGLGILAAARALNLDFVPIATEDYQLLLLPKTLESEAVQALLQVIRDPAFQQEMESLGGYDAAGAGHLIEVTAAS